MDETTMLISINWETGEVLNQRCVDYSQATGLYLSIRGDFPLAEGWTHHIIEREEYGPRA